MYLSVVVIVVWQNLGKKLDVDEVGAGWSAKLVDRKTLETLKVSVGTGNNSELLGSVVARVARIVLRSAGEIVKLRSGARRP